MATVAQDTFTEASDTNLQDHTPDIGTGWDTNLSDSLRIPAGAGYGTSNTDSLRFAREETDIGSSIMDVSIDGYLDTSNGKVVGCLARVADTSDGNDNNYALYLIEASNAVDLRLDVEIATVVSNLGSYDANVAIDTFHSIKLEARATKKGYLAGVERISSTDDQLTSNNFAGLLHIKGSSRYDNFLSESVAAAAASYDESSAQCMVT